MPSPATAHLSPASAAGIVFQVHRMLTRLIKETNAARVGFELFDDIAVEDVDGRRQIEQDKLATSPITDESESIWKTLRNWLRTFRALSTEEREHTFFCIVTNSASPSRSPLALCLSTPNKTDADVAECLRLIHDTRDERIRRRTAAEVTRNGPGSLPKQEDTDVYMKFVIDAPKGELEAIVKRMVIVFGAAAASPEHRAELTRSLFLTSVEDGERVLNTVLGWLTTVLLQFVGKDQDCWVTRDEFSRELLEARLTGNVGPSRLRGEREIPRSERDAVARTASQVYRDRLLAVGFTSRTVEIATERYLSHRAELLQLSLTGAIVSAAGAFRSDRERYYDQLHDGWTSLYLRVLDGGPPTDPAETGRKLLYDVVDRAHKQGLRIGRVEVSQEYFIEGGYHALANQEHSDGEVWWLPGLPIKNVASGDESA